MESCLDGGKLNVRFVKSIEPVERSKFFGDNDDESDEMAEESGGGDDEDEDDESGYRLEFVVMELLLSSKGNGNAGVDS